MSYLVNILNRDSLKRHAEFISASLLAFGGILKQVQDDLGVNVNLQSNLTIDEEKKLGIEKKLTVVLASGGTGGHIFPAEALAAELIANGHNAILISDKRYKKHSLTPDAMEVKIVRSSSSGSGVAGKVSAVLNIFIGIKQAIVELKSIKPDVVVGFGGYPSFPTMVAAILLKIKTVIHEQNCVMGRVNRLLSCYVDKIATSFAEVKGVKNKYRDKLVLTGNPVRPQIKALRGVPYPDIQKNGNINILVTGGSQGASIFSQVVPEAICMLPQEFRNRIKIVQQCRDIDLSSVKQLYKENGIEADLATFFEDIHSKITASHLIIARAGASTVSEITVAGRPAIFVPYIYATDDHQAVNASVLEKKGAAIVIHQNEFTYKKLEKVIKSFMSEPEKLAKMAENSKLLGGGDAVQKLMDCLI